MKHVRFASALLAGAVALTGCADDSAPTAPLAVADAPAFSQGAANDFQTTGNHLVVFKSEQVPGDFAARVAALGGAVELSIGELGAATVSGLGSEAVAALQANPDISTVEPEILFLPPEPVGEPEPVAMEATPESTANPAGAYFFPRQWNLRAIGADAAWAAGHTGSSSVTVAILDTGIGYMHADLAGLVDLERSRSFLPREDPYVEAYFPGAHPVADLGYHGTHVAATVASNARAAAGVTSKTTLMGLKVCGTVPRRGCPGGAIFAAIRYAADNGADVINMSLGGSYSKSMYPGYVSVINRAFAYANRKNVTVVVSAGNARLDLDHDGDGYKTYCNTPTNFCISATGPTNYSLGRSTDPAWENVDAPASYTNYGRSAIDVAAPGGNRSYVYAACSSFSLTIPVCQRGTYIVGLRGTSMASPHVSGLAALMVQKHGKNPARVMTAIQNSADDLGAVGADPFYGKGRINVARAVGLR